MIEGCADWREQGLAAPKIVTDATAEYLEAEDAIAAWIGDCASRDPTHLKRAPHCSLRSRNGRRNPANTSAAKNDFPKVCKREAL